MTEIIFSVDKGVGTVLFNRPEKRNAFTSEMRLQLWNILRAPETQTLNAVIIKAEGKAFCAGVDLNEVAAHRTQHAISSPEFWSVFRQAKPVVIAAVNHLALGLGAGIAMSCDMVIASDDVQFGYPEVEHGLVSSYTTVGLQQLMGARKAFELIITGRRVPAEEALASGMVNELVPIVDLHGRAEEIARRIAALSPLAIHTSKKFFYETAEMPFNLGIRSSERVVDMMRASKGAQQKAASFVAKSKGEVAQ